jgi:Peroxisomal biogenesis factor 11 (PEX11)
MRVGKFLGNVQAASRCRAKTADFLPFIAAAGEGTYFFLDQITW